MHLVGLDPFEGRDSHFSSIFENICFYQNAAFGGNRIGIDRSLAIGPPDDNTGLKFRRVFRAYYTLDRGRYQQSDVRDQPFAFRWGGTNSCRDEPFRSISVDFCGGSQVRSRVEYRAVIPEGVGEVGPCQSRPSVPRVDVPTAASTAEQGSSQSLGVQSIGVVLLMFGFHFDQGASVFSRPPQSSENVVHLGFDHVDDRVVPQARRRPVEEKHVRKVMHGNGIVSLHSGGPLISEGPTASATDAMR